MRPWGRALLLSLFLVPAYPLSAQSPAPAQSADQNAAKKAFQDAERAYRLGDFEKALALYTQAYALIPYPAFLFNIGQCHRNLGNAEKAIFFYQSYLRDIPEARNRDAVEALIADLQKKLEARRMQTRTTTVVITKPAEPVHKKWWFWVVVGAAAAAVGGGVAAATLSQNNEPDTPFKFNYD